MGHIYIHINIQKLAELNVDHRFSFSLDNLNWNLETIVLKWYCCFIILKKSLSAENYDLFAEY